MSPKVRFSFYESVLGKCALVWGGEGVLRNFLPFESPSETQNEVLHEFAEAVETGLNKEMQKVVSKLRLAISGAKVDFNDVLINKSNWSPFNKKIYEYTQSIPTGSTTTYGFLADAIGHPNAFRAVGTALGKNPLPIIIPCHRVLGRDGSLRGFSASNGIITKQILLRLEGCEVQPPFIGYDPLESSDFLAKSDPRLAKLIKLVGPPCINIPRKVQIFEPLSRAIISQQISVKAAQSISRKLTEEFGKKNGNLDIERIFKARHEKLKACGLSENKALYLKELAKHARDKQLPSGEELKCMSNSEVVDSLTKLKGVGKWTAEMILIFQFGRADVLAVDDLALRKGHGILLGKKNHESSREQLETYAKRWRPYRSAGCWYLWRLNKISLMNDYLTEVG